MILKSDDIQTFAAVLGDDTFFEPGFAVRPGQPQFIVAEVGRHKFNEFAKFEYFNKNSERWWIGGMQKWVGRSVWLVADESDGIYIFYEFQGDPKYMQFLGKLSEDCELYGLANEKFTEFADSIA